MLLNSIKVRDKTGEIIVVTKRILPQLKSILRIKGRMGEAFLVADLKLVVLLEDSFEEKGRNK